MLLFTRDKKEGLNLCPSFFKECWYKLSGREIPVDEFKRLPRLTFKLHILLSMFLEQGTYRVLLSNSEWRHWLRLYLFPLHSHLSNPHLQFSWYKSLHISLYTWQPESFPEPSPCWVFTDSTRVFGKTEELHPKHPFSLLVFTVFSWSHRHTF